MPLNAIQQGQVDSEFAAQGEAKTPEIATTPTFVSGTPAQLSTEFNTLVYIAINTAASLKIQLGASSTATSDITLSNNTAAVGLISLVVPAGFYLTLTGTIADMGITSIVQDTQATT